MQKIELAGTSLLSGTFVSEEKEGGYVLALPAAGGGIRLPQLMDCKERYFFLYLEAMEEHSVALNLLVYKKAEEKPAFNLRFGILPGVKTPICIDLEWFSARELFPEANAGALKFVCHGGRVERDEIERVELSSLPAFHDLKICFSGLTLTEEYPRSLALPDGKLVDMLGQNKKKEWPGKLAGPEELKERLHGLQKAARQEASENVQGEAAAYPFDDWSEYGGWKSKQLIEGTGFFSRCKAEGRWWLADPQGYAFFSMGPDCVGLGTDCRVDGVEKWLDWLPERDDPEYGRFYRERGAGRKGNLKRNPVMFSFLQANLQRAFGMDGYERWKELIPGLLRSYGMNTLGNWSDRRLFSCARLPYVTSLPEFPSTRQTIFRDFPDVFSEEYRENAVRAAQALKSNKDDPWMIGYFLRNEPTWAFVNHLVLADEVLYNPARTACKEELVRCLEEKYKSISELNNAWGCALASFEDFYAPMKKASAWSKQAGEDMREFSRRMLRAYVEIPCRECRKADPNHMILGMRWAWVSDADLVTGWENFDVFSINCYAVDPTSHIQRVVDFGVDLPVMIGEFHFGALDRGPTATGLEGVRSQEGRGTAYKHYCERAAAHPNGVGCHYFQCYDQFALGRFDGENYNIGLFDICLMPYEEMLEKVKECSREIYPVMAGSREPAAEKADSIPMIAY